MCAATVSQRPRLDQKVEDALRAIGRLFGPGELIEIRLFGLGCDPSQFRRLDQTPISEELDSFEHLAAGSRGTTYSAVTSVAGIVALKVATVHSQGGAA
jgi:hypothetical protein